MSADQHQFDEAGSAAAQSTSPVVPDMGALDAALRDVFSSTQTTAPELEETIEVVSRAASTIDELVERNRSITEAAVRSVEFFRAQASEAKAEMEQIRKELRRVKEEAEAQRLAARAHAEELEAELALRSMELDHAKTWIGQIRSEVETLLGDAESKLEETSEMVLFD